jgi:hypothetical protein
VRESARDSVETRRVRDRRYIVDIKNVIDAFVVVATRAQSILNVSSARRR